MKTLRLIKFSPDTGTASRYWEEDDFRWNDYLTLVDLSLEQQGVVLAAMAWATEQLPSGFQTLESVELRKVADVVTQWSTPETEEESPTPIAYSPAFVASIVGKNGAKQSAVEIHSIPGPETDGMAWLWTQLS